LRRGLAYVFGDGLLEEAQLPMIRVSKEILKVAFRMLLFSFYFEKVKLFNVFR